MNYLIILFGAPGCGKGHLWRFLSDSLQKKFGEEQVLYIATGDLIREEIKNRTQLGAEIEEIVQLGQLVPDEIVDHLVAKALTGKQQVKVLDGYPRTNAQFDALKEQIEAETKVIAIFRDTPTDLILSRVAKRRVCAECKTVHLSDDRCCPKCGGESLIRKDDAVIQNRLEEFNKNTLPLWSRMPNICRATLQVAGDCTSEWLANNIMSLL